MPSAIRRVELKSPQEIELLRKAGGLARKILQELVGQTRPGMPTRELDAVARRKLKEAGARPAFLGYRGYPASVCVSINDEVVHGIPGDRVIQTGDLVSVDFGLFLNGYCGDTATSFVLGTPDPAVERLMRCAEESLEASLQAARPGNRLGDVSAAMQRVVEAGGFHVVREYGGHGIGRQMHEEPHVPCYGTPGTGLRLEPGMVLALEVMAHGGAPGIRHKPDGWTVLTADGHPAAHFEKMVAVTAGGPDILTVA